jgi:putative oxidoreductase
MPAVTLSRNATIVSWIGQLTAAVILGQTLFFKFTGAPEAVYIFQTLGVEPAGRYVTGTLELVTVVLLLRPGTAATGAVLALGLMVGAIASHLTVLGIEVQGDGGTLFGLAVTTFVAAAVVAWLRRSAIPLLGDWVASSN